MDAAASSEGRVRTAKPQAKPYTLSDGHGLHVIVRPAGAKVWYLSYRIAGRQQKIKLGNYPHVTLRAAREIATTRLGEVAKGDDPAEERRKAKMVAHETSETFSHRAGDVPAPACPADAQIGQRDRAYPAAGISKPAGATELSRKLTRPVIKTAIGEIKERAPIMALNCLRPPARHAGLVHGRGDHSHPPHGRHEEARPKSIERDRILSDQELRQVWNARR